MKPSILIIAGSPKRNGNTDALIKWFCEGVESQADVAVVRAAGLKLKVNGCASCRICQTRTEYGCVIPDGIRRLQDSMMEADVIVMATPLYFFGASAQLKTVVDRMFSLYKWDNEKETMESVLKGKTLVLIASAYEDFGLKELEQPFRMIADYTRMKFKSMLIPNARTSGEIAKLRGIRKKTIQFAQSCL